ncbi:DNA cytosine methyltransferase [Flavobacterium sp. I-SCBP12n]|uniref:Cytosine-specific methyltransferase n=1 Tax=Flavobacterium pygoscelis TaxID=2893176 RepID=A0A9X2BM42_9FLAO|nr:DNA cytosine methyltransferase [Flavobacterium pygoscelis]MCK8142478.1 DNA cytosine methyltransferase [Flavobacterium pygoscelis]
MIKEVIKDKISGVSYKENGLNTLSFFSGALGLDIGLEKEGFNVVLACEFDKACRNTITLNKPNIGLIGDIRNYSVDDIINYSGLANKEQVDVIVGGPPCQAFSTAGKRLGFADSRGNVFLKYLDIIEEISPKYFVIENVRGLMSSILQIDEKDDIIEKIPKSILKEKGSSLYYVIKRLENAGYNINFDLYNSANFGTPQIRERVVIIGTKNLVKVNRLTPTHSENGEYELPKWKTIKEAFKILENIEKHESIFYSEKRANLYKNLKSGQNWKDLPIDLQMEALGKAFYLGGGKTGFMRRLNWNRPSPTVVTNPAMPATDLCHPEEIRPISVEEYKVIQQFPLDWVLAGNTTDKYKQIGNAVPVGLGQAIGREIKGHLSDLTTKDYTKFKHSRYLKTSYDEFVRKMEGITLLENSFSLFD